MLVSFAAVAVNLGLNWLFTFQLGWGHRGLAFSTGCVATFNFLLLYALMRRHLNGLESRRMLLALLQVALACLPLAAVCAASNWWLLADWATQPFLIKLGNLSIAIVVGGAAFAGACLAVRVDEMGLLVAAIRRRIRR
jgi:putative peptidoglycan lipid II flippase